MDIITLVIIVLLAVIAGLGLLLYKTVNRRNYTTEVMAEIVRALAKQYADKTASKESSTTEETTKTIQQ